MWYFIVILIGLFVFTLFGAQNMHQISINFPFKGAVEIRMIFLLLLCFLLGFMTSWIISLWKQLSKNKKRYDKRKSLSE